MTVEEGRQEIGQMNVGGQVVEESLRSVLAKMKMNWACRSVDSDYSNNNRIFYYYKMELA
jgi:hypothetical protein